MKKRVSLLNGKFISMFFFSKDLAIPSSKTLMISSTHPFLKEQHSEKPLAASNAQMLLVKNLALLN